MEGYIFTAKTPQKIRKIPPLAPTSLFYNESWKIRMKRCLIFFTVVIQFIAAHSAQATSFFGLNTWEAHTFYQRGDIVRMNYSIYISLLPNASKISPDSSRAWREVNYQLSSTAERNHIYLPGSVVKHEDAFYISRRINFLFHSKLLKKKWLWQEFSHPGLIYDWPNTFGTEPDSTLLGFDFNNNLIRDDYEYIKESYRYQRVH